MKNLYASILLVSFLCLSQATWAKDSSVLVSGGWQHTASSAYEDGWTGSIRGEHKLYRELYGGIEYTHHGPMEHHTGEDENPFDYGDVSGHSLLIDMVYYFNSWNLIKPYLIVGIGWSWWGFEESQDVKDLGVKVELGDSWAYKVGGGVRYTLSPSWDLVVEWSFFKTDIPKTAKNSDGGDSILLGDDNKHGRITIGEEESRLTAGLRYKF